METIKRVWVAATLDTKSDEADYVCTLLEAAGLSVTLADVSTSGSSSLRPGVRIFLQKTSRHTIHSAGARYLPATGAPQLPQ